MREGRRVGEGETVELSVCAPGPKPVPVRRQAPGIGPEVTPEGLPRGAGVREVPDPDRPILPAARHELALKPKLPHPVLVGDAAHLLAGAHAPHRRCIVEAARHNQAPGEGGRPAHPEVHCQNAVFVGQAVDPAEGARIPQAGRMV